MTRVVEVLLLQLRPLNLVGENGQSHFRSREADIQSAYRA